MLEELPQEWRKRSSPELKPKIEQQDMEPTGPTAKAFNTMYRAELARWTKVARDAGLKAE